MSSRFGLALIMDTKKVKLLGERMAIHDLVIGAVEVKGHCDARLRERPDGRYWDHRR